MITKPEESHAVPDSKINGANMGPTWVLSAPDGHHVGPMNFAIRGVPDRDEKRFCGYWHNGSCCTSLKENDI